MRSRLYLPVGSGLEPAFHICQPPAQLRFDHQFKIGLDVGHLAVKTPILLDKPNDEITHIAGFLAQGALLIEHPLELAGYELKVDGGFGYETLLQEQYKSRRFNCLEAGIDAQPC